MNHVEQEAFFGTMTRHLTEATVEMFEPYALSVALAGEERTSRLELGDRSVVASIGYAGDNIRGSLVLVTSRSAVESWVAALGESPAEADICDVIGEFSNMLLGRLKARLLGEGLSILLSTPTTAFGVDLHIAQSAGACALLSFVGPGWNFEVRIANTFGEGFELTPPAPGDPTAEAGDALFF